ncbi:MAG: hypothetical protein V5A72_01510, partial [Candidatus Nanohaloarchaea archaeon]
ASVTDVLVSGITEAFSSTSSVSLDPGEKSKIYVPAELDRIDVEENDNIEANINFGEQEGVLVNSINREVEFKTGSSSLPIVGSFTESPMKAGGLILLLLVSGGLFYFRDDLKSRMGDLSSNSKKDNSDSGGYSFDG